VALQDLDLLDELRQLGLGVVCMRVTLLEAGDKRQRTMDAGQGSLVADNGQANTGADSHQGTMGDDGDEGNNVADTHGGSVVTDEEPKYKGVRLREEGRASAEIRIKSVPWNKDLELPPEFRVRLGRFDIKKDVRPIHVCPP
jgi:hypothetical protein